jgi:hypothetical protein
MDAVMGERARTSSTIAIGTEKSAVARETFPSDWSPFPFGAVDPRMCLAPHSSNWCVRELPAAPLPWSSAGFAERCAC